LTSVQLLARASVLVALLAAPSSASADQQLAQEQRAFIADTHGGVFVWSSYDAVAKSYRLMTLSNGVPAPLPVAPRPEAFDVSLGAGESGDTVAVYSRCTEKTPRYIRRAEWSIRHRGETSTGTTLRPGPSAS
jgi:hypothetical protein